MTRPTITEAQWQATVVELAQLHGWSVVHHRPARTDQGWRTAVSYDGAGWPDLILLRDRLVVAELKSARGRLTPDQQAWIALLTDAGVETYVWRPDQFDDVAKVLR